MMSHKDPDYSIVDSDAQLKRSATLFEKEKIVACDLEADSMYHFREKVCLLQMATSTESMVIDPLKISDLSSLKPVFANPRIQKIFHGADYDVRSLFRDFQIEIENLFDTQIACMFLGVHETGLDAVIKDRFHVRLNKKYQRKDWSMRPLPHEMMEYAASDVIFLLPLAKLLIEELEKKGRLYWVEEECELLRRVRSPSHNEQPLFLRFKGAGRLDRRTLGVLESLLQFRVMLAEKRDRPLFKVFSNDSLMKVAMEKPTRLEKLKACRVLSDRQIDMFGAELLKRVSDALEIPTEKLPYYPRKKAPRVSPAIPDRVKAIKAWRDKIACRLELEPALLLNKALMHAIALKNPRDVEVLHTIEEMRSWQKKEFGKEIVNVLRKCS
jgi:ribonuclease D